MTRVKVEPSRGAIYWGGEESDHQTLQQIQLKQLSAKNNCTQSFFFSQTCGNVRLLAVCPRGFSLLTALSSAGDGINNTVESAEMLSK